MRGSGDKCILSNVFGNKRYKVLRLKGGNVMRYVVNTKQMSEAEVNSEKKGVSRIQLMKNAAAGCLDFLEERLGTLKGKRVALLCGSGNNGGDGIELAFLLRDTGACPTVVLVGNTPDTETVKGCLKSHSGELDKIFASDNISAALRVLDEAEVIADCVFGTGFHGELPQIAAELFDFAEKCTGLKVSVDIPSGVNGNSGIVSEHSFKPDVTLVLAAMKIGLLNYPCSEFCGETNVVDIGIGEDCYCQYEGKLIDDWIYEKLPLRKRGANKGSFGRLLNVAGCESYIGAAVLSSKAALRIGAGLVTLASIREVLRAAAVAVPECVFCDLPADDVGFIYDKSVSLLSDFAEKANAISIGCGMGNRNGTLEIVKNILKTGDCPVILDADGINSVSENINVLKDNDRPIVLTPHPGEFSRLTKLSVKEIQSGRLETARRFAAETGTVVLLKGADTVIASPEGKVLVNTTGNNALSKAGCGDVLTGIIGGLAAQGVDPFYSAALGAYIHGEAADRLVLRTAAASVLASEAAEEIGAVLYSHIAPKKS